MCNSIVLKKGHTSIKNTLLLKTADHHLHLQWVVIFMPVEGLKYCENDQNITETGCEQMLLEKQCWWTCSKQRCHKPSICFFHFFKMISAKYDKMSYVCISHCLLHISMGTGLRQRGFDTARSEFMTLSPFSELINDRTISSNPRGSRNYPLLCSWSGLSAEPIHSTPKPSWNLAPLCGCGFLLSPFLS